MYRKIMGWLGLWQTDSKGRPRKGSWQQSRSGNDYYSLDPMLDDVRLDDMVWGLAGEGRYANQTCETYSVATHSVIVSVYAGMLARERGWSEQDVAMVEREGLLHDAAEAWISDVARPLKRQRAMRGYRSAEAKWEQLVYRKFGVSQTPESLALIKEIDTRIVLDEIEALMIDPDMWVRTNRYPGIRPLDCDIPTLTTPQSRGLFLARFSELFPEYDVAAE